MKLEKLRILITGGAGFIGSHLVEAVLPKNEVVVIDDLSVGRRDNIEPYLRNGKVRLVQADICDRKAVEKAMDHCDVVFHCAAQCLRISISNPSFVHDVVATGTLTLCEVALERRVKRFVHVSSSEVYGSARTVPMHEQHRFEPTTPYGASKVASEMYALTFQRCYGLPAVVVRPFNTYGPRAHYEDSYGEVIPKFVVRALNNLPPVIFGDGLQTRDFTYVTDTVQGLMLAAQADSAVGDVVNVARGREVSIREVADSVLEILGKRSLRPVYAAPRPADVRRHYASIEKAKALIGFRPRVPLVAGLRRYIDWFIQSVDPTGAILLEKERNWSEALLAA